MTTRVFKLEISRIQGSLTAAQEPAAAPSELDKRWDGARRFKTFLVASIVHGPDVERAHILNLSVSGAQLHCLASVAMGEEITIILPKVRFEASVRWICAGRFGAQFESPITEIELERYIGA